MEGIEGEEPLTLLSFLSPKYVSKGQRALLMRLFQWGEKRDDYRKRSFEQ